MNHFKSLRIIFASLMTVSLVSCVTYYKGDYRTAGTTKAVVKSLPPVAKKKVFLDFRSRWQPKPLRDSAQDMATREEKSIYEDILGETGLFEIVASESLSDEIWQVEDTFHNNPDIAWGLISALTLFVIPYWDTESYFELKLKVIKTSSRAPLYEQVWTENFISINQTLLVLAMPFNYSVPRRIQETSFRKSVEGYLERPVSTKRP